MNEQAIETMLRNLYVELEKSTSSDQRDGIFKTYAANIAEITGDEVMSLTEAADMLGLTRQRVHVLLQNGQLVGYKVGNTWNVYRKSVEQRMS